MVALVLTVLVSEMIVENQFVRVLSSALILIALARAQIVIVLLPIIVLVRVTIAPA